MRKEGEFMTKITEVKSVLAKLLATENLTVEYANVDTASFDVKNRILRIPTMKDLDAKTCHNSLRCNPKSVFGCFKIKILISY